MCNLSLPIVFSIGRNLAAVLSVRKVIAAVARGF
jgi:hypothetical protein